MIVAARIGVLLAVALAAAWALVIGQRQHDGAVEAAEQYVCPMHPQVAVGAPGPCPVCGMTLDRVERVEHSEHIEHVGPGRSSKHALAVARGSSPIQATRLLTNGTTPVHRRALAATSESPAWLDAKGGVTAVLFEDELRDLGRSARGLFFTARAPDTGLAIERAEDPPIHWRGSMWRVGFRFCSGARPSGLRVGTTGWLERPTSHESLVVLSSAILQGQAGPYLLANSPDRSGYRRQPIATGRWATGYTAVISGVRERDLVVGLNAFSLDADAQLQAQRRAAAEGNER